jgi:hypothetical protein
MYNMRQAVVSACSDHGALPAGDPLCRLPLVCTTFFGLQAIEKWSTTQGSKLLVEALEYLLLPSTIYGVMWVIYTPLHNMAWRLVYLVMVKLGGERVSNKPVRWMMAAAIIGHQLVASVTMWVPLLAPALPDAWNPVMLLETAKASLSGMVDRLDLNAGAAMVGVTKRGKDRKHCGWHHSCCCC